MLETIVPKNDTEAIMIVLGKFKGEVRMYIGSHKAKKKRGINADLAFAMLPFYDCLQIGIRRVCNSACLTTKQVGHVLRRDKSRSQAVVQLARVSDLQTLDYDSICHYVGYVD